MVHTQTRTVKINVEGQIRQYAFFVGLERRQFYDPLYLHLVFSLEGSSLTTRFVMLRS